MQLPVTSGAEPVVSQLPNSDALAAVAQLLQSSHGQEVSPKLVLQIFKSLQINVCQHSNVFPSLASQDATDLSKV